jgi:hypothetical protein
MITHVICGYYHINLDDNFYNWDSYMFNLPEEINNKNNNMELKHKIGDVITIKSLDWYNLHKSSDGHYINPNSGAYFTSTMADFCGKTARITELEKNCDKLYYKLDIGRSTWSWEDWMFEDNSEPKEPKIVAVLSKGELKERLTGFKTHFESVTKATELHDLLEKLFNFNIQICCYLNSSHISIDENGDYELYDNIGDYEEANYPFIPIDEILSYKIEETPVPFKAFDKVLVRDYSEEWIPAFFKYFNKADDLPYNTMDGEFYKQCIPYEGNEDKLAYLYEG